MAAAKVSCRLLQSGIVSNLKQMHICSKSAAKLHVKLKLGCIRCAEPNSSAPRNMQPEHGNLGSKLQFLPLVTGPPSAPVLARQVGHKIVAILPLV
jgi:hypothetical protein